MALYGALAENTRRNERIERDSATFTGKTTITVSPPMRTVTSVRLTLITETVPTVTTVTAGNIGSGGNAANQFDILAWQPTSSAVTTLTAGTGACTVEWEAWGTL